jgi:hypothetical protein
MPTPLRFGFVLLAVTGAQFVVGAAAIPDRPGADVTATQDRDQMMAQLGISFPSSLPPTAEDPNRPPGVRPRDPANPTGNWTDDAGNVVVRGGFGLWVTYADQQAYHYPSIDLLRANDGTRITTPESWWSKRRPELFEAVQRDLYGRMPDVKQWPKVNWQVADVGGGTPANSVALTGVIDTSAFPEVRNAPRIVANLRWPANASGRIPVVIHLGLRGADEVWKLIEPEGWALCAFEPNELQPDNGAGLTSYLIGLMNRGNWRKPDDWGSLVAISWGVGRLLDYFAAGDRFDATRVALAGHSRWGKATLVAMVYEPRLAVGYPSCGGALGPALIRYHWGQNLENLSWDREYHWCAGNIFKWMGPLHEGRYLPRKVELLTVDADAMIALVAPRPLFLNGGTTDTWSSPPGTWAAGLAASPVYTLLGKKGVVANGDTTPVPDKDYLEGDLGFRLHTGGHTPMPDWPAFIAFARRYLSP